VRVCATLLAAMLLAIVPAPAQAHPRCHPRGTKTVKADARMRVYTFVHRRYSNYYACLYRVGRGVLIDDDPTEFWIAAPFVFYANDWEGDSLTFYDFGRIDIRTGKIVNFGSFGDSFQGGVTYEDVVPTRRGSLAWIEYSYEEGTSGRSVHAFVAGRERTIDPGPDVEQGSLALAVDGRRVYWISAGQPRSATLR
jgi:hypothetical protein